MTLRDEVIAAMGDEMERRDGSARNALDGLLGWLRANDEELSALRGITYGELSMEAWLDLLSEEGS